MKNEQHVSYKGRNITTRCIEMFDWSARPGTTKATHTPLHYFTGSFSIRETHSDLAWQQFQGAGFGSADAALGNALSAARRSIDQRRSGS